jgi:hypothetical protein
MAQEQMHQRSASHATWHGALSQHLVSKALSMYQDLVGAVTHSTVPKIEQPSIECALMGVQVMDSMADGYALRLQGPHQEYVP